MVISKKIIASALCSTMLFASSGICVPNSAYAAENTITGFNIVDSVTTDSTHSFTLVDSNNDIDIDIEYTDDGFIVNTVANDTETSTLIYNRSTGIATLDGEIFKFELTEPDFNADSNSGVSAFANDYVYVSSAKLNFEGSVDAISKIAGVMTAATLISQWLGVNISKTLVEKKVQTALSAIGVLTLVGSNLLKGEWKADLVRTTEKYNTGYPGSINQWQYKLRYQNINSSLTVAGHKIDFAVDNVGDWYFQDKPMR
ncbi:hypothetical protein [Lysinibacillus xylanilyticus]|uniref:Cytotoxin n=1 Tax=Lysinibacillus xylanilyticus TaxID=582475 RepID=A0ABT4ES48_9BACI|nr:hypothetical protein [Lysinibacillus xylanilyticus]MCY9548499.1 hypothetical protein [Lysinibacillus xylanilyticus]